MKVAQKPLHSGFGAETAAEETASGIDLHGNVSEITGGHSGTGMETTQVLPKVGALVGVGAHGMTKAWHNLGRRRPVLAPVLQVHLPDGHEGQARRLRARIEEERRSFLGASV
jgi:hypothetical protein